MRHHNDTKRLEQHAKREWGDIMDPQRDLGLHRPAMGTLNVIETLRFTSYGQKGCIRPSEPPNLAYAAGTPGSLKCECGAPLWTYNVILGSTDPQCVLNPFPATGELVYL